MDFNLLADHWIKIKESENIEKYLNLPKEMWNKMMMPPIIVGVLGTVPKGLEKRLREMEIRGENRDHLDETKFTRYILIVKNHTIYSD